MTTESKLTEETHEAVARLEAFAAECERGVPRISPRDEIGAPRLAKDLRTVLAAIQAARTEGRAEGSAERERLEARIKEFEAALLPFAAYSKAADAYGKLHRGRTPSPDKNMAYVQTEMGHAANITWGDFVLAAEIMPTAVYAGDSAAKRIYRARHRSR